MAELALHLVDFLQAMAELALHLVDNQNCSLVVVMGRSLLSTPLLRQFQEANLPVLAIDIQAKGHQGTNSRLHNNIPILNIN